MSAATKDALDQREAALLLEYSRTLPDHRLRWAVWRDQQTDETTIAQSGNFRPTGTESPCT